VVSIRARILVLFCAVVGVSSALLATLIISSLRSGPQWREEADLREKALGLAALLARDVEEDRSARYDLQGALETAIRERFGEDSAGLDLQLEGLKVTVTDRDGRVAFDSDDSYGMQLLMREGDTAILTVSVPLLPGGVPEGKLSLSKGREGGTDGSERTERKIIAAVALAGAAAFFMATFGVTWATRPLTAVMRRLEKAEKSLDGTQYVEKYVQTLTHEMKSPLSVLRGAAELLEEEMSPEQRCTFLSNIRRETERIQDLVDRLLQLSAIEGRRGLHDVENIDLAPLVREVVDGMELLLASREIVPDLDLESSAAVWGERFLLRQALANILKNAVEFSPTGGALTLRLRVDGGDAEITVDDAGPGIPDYALDRVFEKFYSLGRPDTGRRSSGLGLPFAREVALLHHGEVSVENMAGGGVRVRLRLPLEPPAS
jgi:two-component system sensor histidine kinase CreC